MAFQEQLSLLKELQSIDLDLHILTIELGKLPSRIEEKKRAFEEIDVEMTNLRQQIEDTEKARRTDEQELEASTEHYRERESKLYAIKTNKEYQAALKEVAEGKRANREREDRIIKAMENIETWKKEIEQLEGQFAEKKGAYEEARTEIEKEEAEIRARMEAESARKPEIEGKLDRDIFRKYGVIRGTYADALVGVVSGVCQGCSRRVPPQLYNELLKREDIRICPNCQRLIFVEEISSSEEEDK